MHTSIMFTMGVGFFAPAMFVLYLGFITGSVQRLGDKMKHVGAKTFRVSDAAPPPQPLDAMACPILGKPTATRQPDREHERRRAGSNRLNRAPTRRSAQGRSPTGKPVGGASTFATKHVRSPLLLLRARVRRTFGERHRLVLKRQRSRRQHAIECRRPHTVCTRVIRISKNEQARFRIRA
jgi:hypothetical protein